MLSSSTSVFTNDTTSDHPSTDLDENDDVFFTSESKVLRDCDTLIDQARLFLNTSTLSHHRTSILSYWSNSHLRKTWTEINDKEEHMVSTLRVMMDEALIHTQSLTLQATHLRWRVLACISATSSSVKELDDHMNYLQLLSDHLEQEEKHTRSLLHFVNEIMAQNEVQMQRRMQHFFRPDHVHDQTFPVIQPISNGQNGIGSSAAGGGEGTTGSRGSASSLMTASDRNEVVKRLHQLREAQSETNLCYTLIQHRHQAQSQLLRELNHVQGQLLLRPRQPLLPREDMVVVVDESCDDGDGCFCNEEKHTTTTTTITTTATTSRTTATATITAVSASLLDTVTDINKENILLEEQEVDALVGRMEPCLEETKDGGSPVLGLIPSEPYDHTLCSDCRVVCELALDCVRRLGNMQKKAHNALSRLQTLLQIREDMLAISAPLHVTTGQGATSTHHPGQSVVHTSGHHFSSATRNQWRQGEM